MPAPGSGAGGQGNTLCRLVSPSQTPSARERPERRKPESPANADGNRRHHRHDVYVHGKGENGREDQDDARAGLEGKSAILTAHNKNLNYEGVTGLKLPENKWKRPFSRPKQSCPKRAGNSALKESSASAIYYEWRIEKDTKSVEAHPQA